MNRILFFLFAMLAVFAKARRELAMIQILFRHGARNPIHGELLVNDPDKDELIRNRADLTEVGMRQLYELGQMIRNEYVSDSSFLKTYYNSSEILILSSNENRTLQSAQGFMAGLYPNGSGKKLPTGINNELLLPPFDTEGFQQTDTNNEYPIPNGSYLSAIHTFGNEDPLLNPSCPKWKKQRQNLIEQHSFEMQSEIQKYKDTIERITKDHLKIPFTFLSHNVTELWDIVHCQKYRGFDYGISDNDLQTLMYLKTLVKLLTKFPIQHSKILASPLFHFLFDEFDMKVIEFYSIHRQLQLYFFEKVQNKTTLKLIVQSSHDGLIMPVMLALNLTSLDCLKRDQRMKTNTCQKFPPFASNLIFELYNKYDLDGNLQHEREIRVRYNGFYINICNGEDFCEYSKFRKLVQGLMATPAEYEEECGQKPWIYTAEIPKKPKEEPVSQPSESQHSEIPWVFIICYVIFAIIIVLLVMHICKLNDRIKAEYQPMKSQSKENEL